ncbi:uncharacterized protein [Panulirus ornatus]|uniref:uncharacterized protein isoform X2 n=1 Tax=Panulirus ornatus TaxID=150431 RepID=UPI003A838245
MRLLLLLASCAVLLAAVVLAEDSGIIMPGVRNIGPSRFAREEGIIFPDSPEWPPLPQPPVGAPTPTAAPTTIAQPGGDPVLELPDDLDQLDLRSLSYLNSFSNISDFMRAFDLSPSEETFEDVGIAVRSGSAPDSAKDPVVAKCSPVLQTVSLDLPVESNTLYFPTCVRLKRCGGCCYGPLLTCRPSETKAVKLRIVKTVTGGNSGSSRGRGNRRRRRQSNASYILVDEVEHTACECDCKVREEDCNNAIHKYMKGECACVCNNTEEKRKCEKQNSTKYWDNDTCNCYCLKNQDCSSGEFFSQTSCRCETPSSRSAFSFPANTNEDLPSFASSQRSSRPGSFKPRRRRPVRVPVT